MHIDVSLLWQKRFRGLLPVAGGALADDGTLTFVRPDELEARTYQVVTVDGSGRLQIQGAVSVETLSKMELAAGGASLIGSTDDDLYLFRDGRKTRLLPGRRLTFADVALARDGLRFVVAFTDAMFAAHTIALCDMSSKVAWTRDLDATLSRVAISSDARHLIVGSEEGRLFAYDAARTPLYETLVERPVTALAMSAQGSAALVGMADGTLLGLNEDGGVTFRAAVGMPILAVALSGDGALGAAVAGDAGGGILVCLSAEGEPLWEHDLEVRPAGVALSTEGRHLAISLIDGRLLAFGLEVSATTHADAEGSRGALAHAQAAWEADEREKACRLLRKALESTPADVAACERLATWEATLVAERLDEAETRAAAGEREGALAALAAAEAIDAVDPRVGLVRQAVRSRLIAGLCEQAVGETDPEAAVVAWQAVLALDFKHLDARRQLGEALARGSERLVTEGDALAAAGDEAGALDRWRRAQALSPSEGLADRIRNAEVGQVFAAGRRLYEQKRYPEAAFQFQKALALDPNHEEARRYLGYARGLVSDSGLTGRFQRLE